MKKKFQIIKLSVTSANQRIKIDTETNTQHTVVTGVFATTSNDGYKNSTLELSVDEQEITPKDFEVALIMPTSTNTIKEITYPLQEKAKGSKVAGEYIDGGSASAYPYEVRIYLTTTEE